MYVLTPTYRIYLRIDRIVAFMHCPYLHTNLVGRPTAVRQNPVASPTIRLSRYPISVTGNIWDPNEAPTADIGRPGDKIYLHISVPGKKLGY